jgi:hypothetical protein
MNEFAWTLGPEVIAHARMTEFCASTSRAISDVFTSIRLPTRTGSPARPPLFQYPFGLALHIHSRYRGRYRVASIVPRRQAQHHGNMLTA